MTAEWKPAKGTTVGHTKFNIQTEMRWAMGMDRKAEFDKKRNLCIASSFCPCGNCSESRDESRDETIAFGNWSSLSKAQFMRWSSESDKRPGRSISCPSDSLFHHPYFSQWQTELRFSLHDYVDGGKRVRPNNNIRLSLPKCLFVLAFFSFWLSRKPLKLSDWKKIVCAFLNLHFTSSISSATRE